MSTADGKPVRRGRDDMRAADTDRDVIVERLRAAAAEGRLTLEELDERLGLALTSKTFGELDEIVADLPSGRAPAPRARSGERPLVLKSGTGSVSKAGYWEVPARLVVQSGMGGARLDFSAAVCHHHEVAVELEVGMGSVLAIVPKGWGADAGEVSVSMGSVGSTVGPPEAGLPMLRFSGQLRMGSLKIRHPKRLEEARARRIREGR